MADAPTLSPSRLHTVRYQYGKWWIYYDPPPIPVRDSDWHYVHDDYDGAPDGHDHRAGSAASLEACQREIDEYEEDHGR